MPRTTPSARGCPRARKPIMVVITRTGRGMAKSCTSSHSPLATIPSSRSFTMPVMSQRCFSAPSTEKKGSASSRYRRCTRRVAGEVRHARPPLGGVDLVRPGRHPPARRALAGAPPEHVGAAQHVGDVVEPGEHVRVGAGHAPDRRLLPEQVVGGEPVLLRRRVEEVHLLDARRMSSPWPGVRLRHGGLPLRSGTTMPPRPRRLRIEGRGLGQELVGRGQRRAGLVRYSSVVQPPARARQSCGMVPMVASMEPTRLRYSSVVHPPGRVAHAPADSDPTAAAGMDPVTVAGCDAGRGSAATPRATTTDPAASAAAQGHRRGRPVRSRPTCRGRRVDASASAHGLELQHLHLVTWVLTPHRDDQLEDEAVDHDALRRDVVGWCLVTAGSRRDLVQPCLVSRHGDDRGGRAVRQAFCRAF